ncbi:hypothetical protein HYFRA_00011368 [Hymenoscyphus fraxineus]|uniref:L-ornithine N(5)-monooxygenase [NAD(P)H] n=1 Tax=Hymenoscyphus fraxineus TaxID=746836 RepID=A0A9N9PJ54_9HELO|nr:hypothetical protein HYFRA_00011368 [Hymenoscyphus fraxineus]
MEEFDLIIIGAGPSGLPLAKTHLQLSPLLILEAQQSVGGTWAKERVYPGLISNNLHPLFEYSDFPMSEERFGTRKGEHIEGAVLSEYFHAYAVHFGILGKIRFGARGEGKREMVVRGRKLVCAMGSTSQEYVPRFRGMEGFKRRMFHSKEVPWRRKDMEGAENVVVVGGSKSAADAVYMNASEGRHVDWIIRASGKGPAWLSWPHVSPFQLHVEKLSTTRFFTFLSPCFDTDSYPTIRKFFHNTRIGRFLVRSFFKLIEGDLISQGKYNDHPESKKLIPPQSPFWSGTSLGIFNYPTDFMSLFQRGLIHVHRVDISELTEDGVLLSSGEEVKADTLILATGWKLLPSVKFLPENVLTDEKMGLTSSNFNVEKKKAAAQELVKRFPVLSERLPTLTHPSQQTSSSYSLYHASIPPHLLTSRNFAYAGLALSLRGLMVYEIQALWLLAFLSDSLTLPVPTEEEAEWEAISRNVFYQMRAGQGIGGRSTDMAFEILPFTDTLVRELGLRERRKGGWREVGEYYGVGDYKGLVEEWMEKEGRRK